VAARFFQARPSESKENCLDLLGLIRQNQDFSMGCDEENKKYSAAFLVRRKGRRKARVRFSELAIV
jgi:hypothetical protein